MQTLQWPTIQPSHLEVVDIGPEIDLDFLVYPFHLSISLWMKGSAGVCLYPNHPIEFFHELGDELQSPVTQSQKI